MGWHLRIDRFFYSHNVFRQEHKNSCGPSCILMALERFRGYKGNDKEILSAYSDYGQGAATDGSQYTFTSHLAQMLRNICGRGAVQHLATPAELAGRIVASVNRDVPIVVLTNWDVGGGHFVLIDKVANLFGKQYATVCDPWDGHVHVIPITANEVIAYEPTYGSQTKDNLKFKGGAQCGMFSGWTVEFS